MIGYAPEKTGFGLGLGHSYRVTASALMLRSANDIGMVEVYDCFTKS